MKNNNNFTANNLFSFLHNKRVLELEKENPTFNVTN